MEVHTKVFISVKKRTDETSGLILPVLGQQGHRPKQQRPPNTLLQVAMVK